MALVKLWCGVYDEGSVFFVEIEGSAKVKALQEAILYDQRYNHHYKFSPSAVTLYLARKANGAWFRSDPAFEDFLKQGRLDDGDASYVKMIPNWILDEDYLGANFKPGRKEIQVLVELPTQQETSVAGAASSIVTSFLYKRKRWELINEMIQRHKKSKPNMQGEEFIPYRI